MAIPFANRGIRENFQQSFGFCPFDIEFSCVFMNPFEERNTIGSLWHTIFVAQAEIVDNLRERDDDHVFDAVLNRNLDKPHAIGIGDALNPLESYGRPFLIFECVRIINKT